MAPNETIETRPLLSGYLTRKELAREMRVTIRTLARWHWQRQGPPSVLIAGRRLYRRAAVESWMRAQEVAA